MKLLSLTSVSRWIGSSLSVTVTLLALPPTIANASPVPALIDDFSATQRHGTDRPLVDDKSIGSQSHAARRCADGVLSVKGELIPGRGAPAFISIPLLLVANAAPQDVSAFKGIRLRVKIDSGSLLVQTSSADIKNFDYHTSPPIARTSGGFQEVRVAFKDMKRGFSEQTALNLKSVTSINLLVFGMAKDSFAYEVDEVSFY
jgi:hypothetical protein